MSSIPTDGLRLNLNANSLSGADNDQITNWNGYTGTGVSNVPKLSLNITPRGTKAVKFTASDGSHFLLGNLMSGATAGEAFIVARNAVVGDFSLWKGGSNNDITHYPYGSGIYEDWGIPQRPGPFTPPEALTGWHIYNVSSGPKSGAPATLTMRLRQGSASKNDLTDFGGHEVSGYNGVAQFNTAMLLGKGGNGWYYNGHVAAVVMYARVLSDSERTQVFNALKAEHLNTTVVPDSPVLFSGWGVPL